MNLKEKDNFEIFMNELRYLKSGPEESDTCEYEKIKVKKQVGMFIKKTLVTEENGNLLKKGNYISLYGICKIFENYLIFMDIARKEFLNNSEREVLFNKYGHRCRNTHLEYKLLDNDILLISIGNIKLNVKYDELPVLIEGSEEEKAIYDKLRKNIYEYLIYINSYKELEKYFLQVINISERTTLKFSVYDIFKDNSGIILTLQFCDFALLEVQIKRYGSNLHDKKQGIITTNYSKDKRINTYLNENNDSLLEEIFIEESKVEEILSILNGIIS